MPASKGRWTVALLMGVCLGGLAAAHDPEGGDHEHRPRAVDGVQAADWAKRLLRRPAPSKKPLRLRAAGAPLVIAAKVAGVDDYDGGKLRVGRILVRGVHRGPSGITKARVVDIRGALKPAAWLTVGTEVVAILAPAPDYSYLDEHLPALASKGRYYQPVAVFRGLTDDATNALVDWLALRERTPGAANRPAALRLLAAGERTLARHAMAELAAVPVPESLAPAEREAVAAVMQGPLPGKAGLAYRLGEWGLVETADLLRAVVADDAVTRARVWAALAGIGAPLDAERLAAAAGADDPAMRAAAAWARGHVGDDAAIEALVPALADADPDVRRVAIAALGRSGHPRTAKLLSDALDSASRAQRVAVARALNRLDSRVSAAVLALTARHAEHSGARVYAAKLLVARVGVEATPVRKLLAQSDDAAVKRILAEGVVDGDGLHQHGHGAVSSN